MLLVFLLVASQWLGCLTMWKCLALAGFCCVVVLEGVLYLYYRLSLCHLFYCWLFSLCCCLDFVPSWAVL